MFICPDDKVCTGGCSAGNACSKHRVSAADSVKADPIELASVFERQVIMAERLAAAQERMAKVLEQLLELVVAAIESERQRGG